MLKELESLINPQTDVDTMYLIISRMRATAIDKITNLLKSHESGTASFVEASTIPILQESDTDDGVYTLDRVYLNKKGNLVFEGSNSYDNIDKSADDVDIQSLLFILDEMETDESLFEPEEDDEDTDE